MKISFIFDFIMQFPAFCKVALLMSALMIIESVQSQDRYVIARQEMIRVQLKERGINDKATLAAMQKVERHKFVPPEMMRYAYEDRPLTIGYDQTISQPYIVAFMTGSIKPARGMKVLEIGTGSGYQAAVLAEIVDSVFTIEIVEPLGRKASALLKSLGYGNVKVRIGDGFGGWAAHAPFDAIIVTAAAIEMPPPLFSQLKEGGRMIIPIGEPYGVQTLYQITKVKGKAQKKAIFPVRFVPFTRDK